MRDESPISTARREARRLERLGDEHPICLHCGCAELALLIPVTKRFLEEHHVLGENHDPDRTKFLCRNCHYLATENLLRADVSMLYEPDPLKRVVTMLRASAVDKEMEAESLRRMANLLEKGETQ